MKKHRFVQLMTKIGSASLILLLALAALPAQAVQAASITSAASGSWSAASTWVGGVVPGAADDVTIANGHTVTLDLPTATVNSLVIQTGNKATGLTIIGSYTLTVTTTVSVEASTANNVTKSLEVGDGSLKVGTNLSLAGGTSATRLSQISINTGTATVVGNLNLANVQSKVIFSGTGTLNVAGTFQSTGSLTAGSGMVIYNGAAQTLAAYTYNNLALSGSGLKTIPNGTTVSGDMIIRGTAKADIGAGLSIPVNALSLGGTGRLAGTWGSTSSAATNKNDTYFNGTGVLNVATTLATNAPTVSSSSATGITRTTATLNGSVNANGDSTIVKFEYGLTSSYGSSITAAQSPLTGSTSTAVSALLAGLLVPGTTYHFRVVGMNSGGISYSTPDRTFPTSSAGSITYYVDNTNASCSDAGSGTLAVPFCTIGAAASLAGAGDTVSVVAGTYAETVEPAYNGGVGMPLTFTAAPGVTVTGEAGNTTSGSSFRLVNKGYIVIDGFTISGSADHGIYAKDSNHIQILNNHVSGSGAGTNFRNGIYLTGTTASKIKGNTTENNKGDGIRLNNGSSYNQVEGNVSFGNALGSAPDAVGINLLASSNDNWIIRNITYANEDSGINFYTGSSYNYAINNLSYGNGDHGIDNNASPYNTLVGNTVHGNVTVGINFELNSFGATLANNISVDNGYRLLVGGTTLGTSNPGNLRVDATSVTGTTLDYDLIYSGSAGVVQIIWSGTNYTSLSSFQAGTGQETHGLQSNPLFLTPAAIAQRPTAAPYNMAVNVGDYHVGDLSPAIDSANSDAPNEQTIDIEGNPRVDIPTITNSGAGPRLYDDRGAYEYLLKSEQVITWTSVAPATATYLGPTYTPTATATSTLPVTITVDPTASLVCSIDGLGVVSFIGVGTCVLNANQAGGPLWLPAAQVQQNFAVGKADQTITFDAPASPAVYHTTFEVTPTASSGLPVTIIPSGSCSILVSTVTMTSGTGTCTLTASQAGGELYNPAVDVIQTVVAAKASQVITFAAPASPAAYLSTFEITPTSDSGLPVTITPSGVCSLLGTTVTMTSGTGVCALTASQAGDDNFNLAVNVVQVVDAQKIGQVITFAAPASPAGYLSTFEVAPTSDSGLPVTVIPSSACTILGNTVTMTSSSGTCTLTASQVGNENYNPAVDVVQTVTAQKGSQVIIFLTTPPSHATTPGTYVPVASSTSGLPVVITVDPSSSAVCSISVGGVVSLKGIGLCTLNADQAGNADFYSAPRAQQSFVVTQGIVKVYLPLVRR